MKLSDHIKSLSLKKGDMLVVTRRYAGRIFTWQDHLQKAAKIAGIDFDVPIIFVDELSDIQVQEKTCRND